MTLHTILYYYTFIIQKYQIVKFKSIRMDVNRLQLLLLFQIKIKKIQKYKSILKMFE